MHRVKVLIIGSPGLAQIIGHLFQNRPEFEVVGTTTGLRSLAQKVERLLPELIVANLAPVRADVCKTVASVKRSSPSSRLVVVCPIRDLLDGARKCGADAGINPEHLVSRLVPTLLAMSAQQTPERAVAHAV